MSRNDSRELENQLAAVQDRLFRHCKRLCGGRHDDAEDLYQDVMVQVLRYQHTFVCFTGCETHAFARWCEVIATRILWNRAHRGKPHVDEVSMEDVGCSRYTDEAGDPGQAVIEADTVDRFFKMLDRREQLAVGTLMDPKATRVEAAEASGLTYRQVQKLQERMMPIVAALCER